MTDTLFPFESDINKQGLPAAPAHTVSQETIATLVIRYQNRLLHLAASYLHDMQGAEDCVQDVFTTAIRKLNPELPEEAVYRWLAACTSNRAKSVLRSARVKRLFLMDRRALEEKVPGVRDDYSASDESGVLAKVLSLPIKYREVIVLKYFHDLSITDISGVLKLPENTVKTRLRRGKEKLRQALLAEEGVL